MSMTFPSAGRQVGQRACAGVGRRAVAALYAELALEHKPGLVGPTGNGSHSDMSMALFMRSLFALRSYFAEIAVAGADGGSFRELQGLGLAAEQRMLVATSGVNTHRGAVFSLGLLCAATGLMQRLSAPAGAVATCRTVRERWGADIAAARASGTSNGQNAVAVHGGMGARLHAAAGFPVLVDTAIPAWVEAKGLAGERQMLHVLFSLIAGLNDTNLLHRGGSAGLAFAQARASRFLRAGSTFSPDWRSRAAAVNSSFIARRLSPGGAADLLACTHFLLADGRP